MAGKEGHRGFGYVRKLASGRFQASYQGPDQARHSAPSTFTGKIDAEGWLTAEYRLIERGEWTSPAQREQDARDAAAREAADTLTLADYANNTWLPQRTLTANHGRGLAPKTAAEYRKYLDRLILPTLGDIELRHFTAATISKWTGALNRDTARLNHHAHTLLKSIFATAVDDGLLNRTPFKASARLAPPKRRISEPATIEEVEAIAEALPERLRLMVLLAAWCALRFGEVAELRRSDVDLDRGLIKIRRAVQWVDGVKIVKAPKAESMRDVHFPPHLAEQLQTQLTTHAQPGEDGLLFPTTNGGQYRDETFTKAFWRKARAAGGRPDLRFHDLRHTGATLAAASGATLAELMARLGHSTVTAALAYQHASQGGDKRIAAQLSAARGATPAPKSKSASR